MASLPSLPVNQKSEIKIKTRMAGKKYQSILDRWIIQENVSGNL